MATNLNEYEIYGGKSSTPLQGILKIEKDTDGNLGLEIPGLLSINNKTFQGGEEIMGTDGNLCLRQVGADYLQADPNVIFLTQVEGSEIEYLDSQGLFYAVDTSVEGGELHFNGIDSPEKTMKAIPTWTKDSTFYTDKMMELVAIDSLVFDPTWDTSTATIIVPSTVSSFFEVMKNFSGILDIHYCTLSDATDMGTFENCENGTLHVNTVQWDLFNTAGRITTTEGVSMLDHSIKIVQVSEGGSL